MKQTLYARDSKGKILHWTIAVKTTGMKVDIMKSYGELDGNSTIRFQYNIQGKNIGKSNETSPYQQAILQIESEIKNKKDKGYLSIEDINIEEEEDSIINLRDFLENNLPACRQDASGGIKPMKAQQYYRSKKQWISPNGAIYDDRKYFYMKNPYVEKEDKSIIIKFPCMAQPKINGVRATIQEINGSIVIKSKEGLEYNIPHISDYFNMNIDLFNFNGIDLVLDGELYIHGEILGDIASAVNKVSLMTQRLIYVVFDLAIPEKDQKERWRILKNLNVVFTQTLNCPVQLIRAFNVNNDNDAQIITDRFISEGYEGTIFRDYNAEYKFGGRPMTMVKLKRTISEEFTIVDILPQEKDYTKGNFQCVNKSGDLFLVDPKGTDEYKRELLLNKNAYKGKKVTLVFYEWTADYKPYHIIECTIRNYE